MVNEKDDLSLAKEDPCCSVPHTKPWFQNKTLIVLSVLLMMYGLSYLWPFLIPFRETLWLYVQKIWWAILLGFTLGGMIDYYVPSQYISHVLSREKKRTIVHAVLFGSLMSACSCGVLALSIQLHKKGASTASVIAFLMASPWANLPLTFMLIGFFGFLRTSYIVLAAIVIAMTTGFIYQYLEKINWVERNTNSFELDENFSVGKDVRKRIQAYRFSFQQLKNDITGIFKGAIFLSNMVLWWILIGIGLSSLAGAYIPQQIFHQYMGPTLTGMLVTLAVATVIEVCSEGTSPLAFEIFRQTGAFGNSLVFLMAGVATDYTEIGLLWHNVGRRAAIWLPVISVPQIILWGILANILF